MDEPGPVGAPAPGVDWVGRSALRHRHGCGEAAIGLDLEGDRAGRNLATSLHRDTLIVRLPEDERRGRLEAGWQQFEPMPGRPMREYLAVPDAVAADATEARRWMERAADYVRTLPPKAPKAAKKARPSRQVADS